MGLADFSPNDFSVDSKSSKLYFCSGFESCDLLKFLIIKITYKTRNEMPADLNVSDGYMFFEVYIIVRCHAVGFVGETLAEKTNMSRCSITHIFIFLLAEKYK